MFLRLDGAQAQAQLKAERGRVAASVAQARACEAAKVTVPKVVGPKSFDSFIRIRLLATARSRMSGSPFPLASTVRQK